MRTPRHLPAFLTVAPGKIARCPFPVRPHPSSPADALRRLLNLRWLSIGGMLAVVVSVPWLLDIPLPARPCCRWWRP
jgi:hypothetical protein